MQGSVRVVQRSRTRTQHDSLRGRGGPFAPAITTPLRHKMRVWRVLAHHKRAVAWRGATHGWPVCDASATVVQFVINQHALRCRLTSGRSPGEGRLEWIRGRRGGEFVMGYVLARAACARVCTRPEREKPCSSTISAAVHKIGRAFEPAFPIPSWRASLASSGTRRQSLNSLNNCAPIQYSGSCSFNVVVVLTAHHATSETVVGIVARVAGMWPPQLGV